MRNTGEVGVYSCPPPPLKILVILLVSTHVYAAGIYSTDDAASPRNAFMWNSTKNEQLKQLVDIQSNLRDYPLDSTVKNQNGKSKHTSSLPSPFSYFFVYYFNLINSTGNWNDAGY